MKKNENKKPSFLEELEKLTKNQPKKKPSSGVNPWTVVLLLLVCLFFFFWRGSGATQGDKTREEISTKIGINSIVEGYQKGLYSDISIEGSQISAKQKDTKEIIYPDKHREIVTSIDRAILPVNDTLADLKLNDSANKTQVSVKDDSFSKMLGELLPSILLLLLMGWLFVFFFGKMGGGSNGPMAFIKSRARIYEPTNDRVTFKDVAGSEEEKEELVEVVDFLKNPKKYRNLGAKIPRGVLLVGPPGTGKTLLARAVAGESDVPFFSISGSEFVEMFVGVGAARVRDLFKEAKERAPSIIFIDEIDAIGKKRSPGVGGGHDEREQTLNQILTEMDGFDNETDIILMAATNRPDVLDKALTRPGRFDRKVYISLPNIEDRIKILAVHAKNKPMDKDVDWRRIAAATVGFSGADLANLLNEAAIFTGKLGTQTITQDTIQKSIEKVLLGNAKRSFKMTEGEKKITAYHEIGHAILHKMLPHSNPVSKVSIISRGGALGVTWSLPERDQVLATKAKYLDELAAIYGGRAAEEIFFGKENITTGASNDIEKATDLARAMIMQYGFDDELGATNYMPQAAEAGYYGQESVPARLFSEKTQEQIDKKVRTLLDNAYATAIRVISENKELHIKISDILIKKEELIKEEFDEFFEGIAGVPDKVTL